MKKAILILLWPFWAHYSFADGIKIQSPNLSIPISSEELSLDLAQATLSCRYQDKKMGYFASQKKICLQKFRPQKIKLFFY